MRNLIVLISLLNSIASFGQSIEQEVTFFLDAYKKEDYSTALKYEDHLIEAFKPYKDTTYIDILTLLGKSNELSGKKERAKQLAIENYEIATQFTTPINPRYYRAINALADLYKNEADYNFARKYYQEAWDSFQRHDGAPVSDKIQTRSNLAFTYLMTGDFALSASTYEANLQTIASNFGEQNETYVSDLYLLADAQDKMGEQLNAFTSYEKTKQIYNKLYGKFNSQAAFCSINQALALVGMNTKQSRLQSLKYFNEFEQYHKSIVDTISETYLTYQVSYGLCLNTLSYDFPRVEKNDSAQHFSEKSKYVFKNIVNTYRQLKIDNAENLRISLTNLGSIADVQKNYADAVKYYQQVIDIFNKNKTTENSSDIIYYQSRLGNSLIKSGEKSKGEKILNNVKSSLSQIMENDPMGAFGVLSNLGTLCDENNDIQGQIEIENISLSHGRKVFKGEVNEQVLLSHRILANHYYVLKNADSICYHYEKARNISKQLYGENNTDYIETLTAEISYFSVLQLDENQSKHLENLFEDFEKLIKEKDIDQTVINDVLLSKQHFYSESNDPMRALHLQQSESKYVNNEDTLTNILLRTAEIDNLTSIGRYYEARQMGYDLILKNPHLPKSLLMRVLRTVSDIPSFIEYKSIEAAYLKKWCVELHNDEKLWKEDPRVFYNYIYQNMLYCKIITRLGYFNEAINESKKCLDLLSRFPGDHTMLLDEINYNLCNLSLLSNKPNDAISYINKSKSNVHNEIRAKCQIALGNYAKADELLISYFDTLFKNFQNEINKLSENDFRSRKNIITPQLLELLNYSAFRAEKNPKLLDYAINKWFYFNDLGLRKGRLYKDLSEEAGLKAGYENGIKTISEVIQLPIEIRQKENLNIDDLMLEQRKIEMLIGEKTNLFYFDNSIDFLRKQLNPGENYVFVIPFSYLDLNIATSADIAKKDGNYAFFVGNITKNNPKIEFTILNNAFELREEAYQRYISYLSKPMIKPTEDVESYSYFIKPIEKFFQYDKTYFCGADVYLDINIESIYHPIEKKSILETYNISFVDALTNKLQNNASIRLDEVVLFGDVSYGDGSIKANKINEYNSSNSIIGINTLASSNKNSLIIYKLEPNFPAERAGLVLGDEIIEINGEKIDIRVNSEAFYLSKIRGKEGTEVNLKIKRNVTNEIFDVTLKRSISFVASPVLNWDYLKGTKIEIQEISKVIQANSKKITIYSEENASEDNLKKIENPSVLHIATHSFYIDGEKNSNSIVAGVLPQEYKYSVFLLNGLVMSGGNDFYYPEMQLNKENGFVNGLEISLLNLENTELVVISGCESGQGVHGIGEGVSGLKEALFRAGAQQLILAKYPISDRATQDFFIEFYSRLSSGSSIEEILRETKIEINKKYKHPYYWSAFQLYKR